MTNFYGDSTLQIEKVVLFLLEQQGLLARKLFILGEQRDALLEQQDDGSKSSELQEEYRAVGRDLLRLLFFIEMNAIGLRKILKKFDKRFGYKFMDYYVKTRANHPYSQLQQVFKHVVRSINQEYLLFNWSISGLTFFPPSLIVVAILTVNLSSSCLHLM